LSKEIEELMKIVEQEKVAENAIEQARRNAEGTIKTATEKANKIMMEAKSVDSEESQHEMNKEFEEKKRRLQEEHKRKLDSLNKCAETNLEQAVKKIIENVMKVTI
jgi:vacuolar-type H+-ATPase subunit H